MMGNQLGRQESTDGEGKLALTREKRQEDSGRRVCVRQQQLAAAVVGAGRKTAWPAPRCTYC